MSTPTATDLAAERLPGSRGRLPAWSDHPWAWFAVRRLGRFVASMWALVTLVFLMIHLVPGDPVRAALGLTADPDLVAAKRAELGLDDPLWRQYVSYVGDLLHGDLGTSLTSRTPVAEIIGERIGPTFEIAVLAFLLAVVVAVPLGALMGVLTRAGHGRRTELGFTTTTVLLAAIPEFLLGVGLVYVFGVHLGWLPVAGNATPLHYVLPVVSLAVGPAALLARIVRIEMVTVLQADFIRTARAKRLRRTGIYLKHALPNALTATVTIGGLLLGAMVAGTVLVESVFAWPGLGGKVTESILTKDYRVVQGVVLVFGGFVLVLNLLVDLVLALLDPRSAIRDA